MLWRLGLFAIALYLAFAAWWVIAAGAIRDTGDIELLNVACDPTRELWREVNAQFIADYQQQTHQPISIRQSHGGSGSQARAVIDGLDADVVTLALFTDTDVLRKAGRLDPDWQNQLPNRSLPFVSTIVFVVRKANPKNLHDWPDLARPGVQVITPNPKTSGNGKWSFLAMWGAYTTTGRTDAEAFAYLKQVYAQVPIRDTSARGATMTFAQKQIGDVHLTWENEAYLEVQEAGGELEIVYPPRSVLAEPHVAVVSAVARRKGTEAAAKAYLNFLYTDAAQRTIAKHFYRPTNERIRQETAAQFPALVLFRATELGENWDTLNTRFFAEGGVFDQLSTHETLPR